MYSFVFSWQTGKNEPRNQVAKTINSEQAPHAARLVWLHRNLREWIAWINASRHAHARVSTVIWFRFAVCCPFVFFNVVVIELVPHEGLVSILENRQVFELFQVPWNVVWRDEETCKQHERNDQHRCQCHSKLFVREWGWDNERITATCVVDENENNFEEHEVFKGWIVSNSVVDDAAENSRD